MSPITEAIKSYQDACQDAYQETFREVNEREEQKILAGQRKDFHFLAANLASFLPHIPKSDYESIYRRILTNHRLSRHNFKYVDFGAVDHISVSGDKRFLEPEAKRIPRIFCTYHLGGYRAVLAMLLNAGYPLALVVDGRLYREQKEHIEAIVDQLNAYKGTSVTALILNAESVDIGKRMAMAMAAGHSILIFPDGNTGVGGVYHRNARQLKVQFLGQKIHSRTGIATLSHALRKPITPIVSYYPEANGSRLLRCHCEETIDPRQLNMSQEEYIRFATTKLYGILANHIERYVDQWESWFYIHKFLDTDDLAAQAPADLDGPADLANDFVFDTNRYGLFKLEQDGYLFDKQLYRSYALTESLYDGLSTLSTVEKDNGSSIEWLRQQSIGIVDQLCRQRVLVAPRLTTIL